MQVTITSETAVIYDISISSSIRMCHISLSFIVIKPKMKWLWGYEANCLFNQEHYLKGPLGKKAQCIL